MSTLLVVLGIAAPVLSVALAAAMVREARRERRREPVRVLFYSERDR